MITIINYGLGNLNAFVHIFNKYDIPVKIAQQAKDLENTSKIILPGVGAFDYAMTKLNESGIKPKLDELVCEKKIPVLGICVGMQILANSSEEGILPGLGYINGRVKKFDPKTLKQELLLPHMGWNDIKAQKGHALFKNFNEEPLFYFLHSYYFECKNSKDSIALASYGKEFVCAVNHDNVYGVQFHPEKSHHYGIKLLNNFAEL
jgi:imidazole glycerol phosphate synthase, glutamine amidotransferase subunit